MASPIARYVIGARALDAIGIETRGELEKLLQRKAARVQARASQLCPVDTGRLRASIDYEVTSDSKGLVAFVGTPVEYAIFVELGTSRMSAQPFLRPALDAAKD